MLNFIQKILKQKKIIFFAFLFLIILAIALPKITSAQSPSAGSYQGAVAAQAAVTATNNVNKPIKCPNFLDNATGSMYCGVFTSFADVIDAIFYRVSLTITQLFSMILAYTMDRPITTNQKFVDGWTTVRDFANMIIVLGFVIVGIATALRIQEYAAKKLLPLLIMVALLVNFSGLFCGLIIDASNITMKSLALAGAVSGTQGTTMISVLKTADDKQAAQAFDSGGTTGYIISILWFCVFYTFVGVTFFVLGLILMERYIILAMLYILSPAAFVFWVFPASKKLWTEWWNHFLKWTFVGVESLFFLAIAVKILNGTQNFGWIDWIVVLAFMLAGAKIAVKSSGIASAAAIGLAGSALTMATGGVGAVAMGGLKAAGRGADAASGGRLSAAGQKISGGVGRTMERLGIRKTGTTALSKASELGESEKRMSALVAQGDLASVQRIARGEGMNKSAKERAGATAALLKTKNFDPTDDKQKEGLNYFQSQGGNLGEYSAKDPRLARHDISATNNTIAKEKAKGNILTDKQAAQKNVADSYSRLGVRGMRDLSASAMDVNFLANVQPRRNAKAADEYSKAQIDTLKKYTTPGTEEYDKQDAEQTRLLKTGKAEDLEKANRILENIIEIQSHPNFK